MNTKFKFGVEYTFVPKKGEFEWHDPLASDGQAKLVQAGYRMASLDGGAIEVPSMPTTSLAEHKKWVAKLYAQAKKVGLTPRRVDVAEDGTETVYGTGGGHIHVELPQESSAVRAGYIFHMIEFVARRPYLNWIFNEFMDDENANHIGAMEQVRDFLRKEQLVLDPRTLGRGSLPEFDIALLDNLPRMRGGKSNAISFHQKSGLTRYNTPEHLSTVSGFLTTEFRFFDAPRTVQMAMEHIRFAKAIHERVLEKTIRSNYSPTLSELEVDCSNAREVRRIGQDYEHIASKFRYLCIELGVSQRIYEPYLQNYRDRIAYGSLT